MTAQNERAAFVKSLQDAVSSAKKPEDLKATVSKINEETSGSIKKARGEPLTMHLYTEYGGVKDQPSLRVTMPTRTVVSAELSDPSQIDTVEFYLTRLRRDGRAETRLIGSNRYRDGDGRFGITFLTERFERTPHDPIMLHAEALDDAGRLLAISAIAPHP